MYSVRLFIQFELSMFSINLNRSSKSISPVRSIGRIPTSKSTNLLTTEKTRLYNLPKIPSYYKIDRPSLSQQMRRNIEQKLSLDKTVEISMKKREKSKDYFLKYNKNPFSSPTLALNMTAPSLQKKSKKPKPQSSFQKKDKVYDNIVEAVNSCREVSPIFRDKSFKQVKKQAVRMSEAIQYNAKKINCLSKDTSNKEIKSQIIIKEMDLQAILSMEDENYYLQHQRSINIFECLKGPPKVLNHTILFKYHFNFTSIVEKPDQNIRFPLYRDLSQKARKASMKNRYSKQQLLEFICSNDINTDCKKVRFEDILGLASGRCTPELVISWINHKDTQFKFDEIAYNLIILKENTKNFCLNHAGQEENLMEIKQWKMNDNPDQKKYGKKCRKIAQHLVAKMEEKVKVSKKRVADKNAHKELNEQLKQEILYFLNKDSKVKEKVTIQVQGVQNSKLTSTKARNLKNNQLITTMRQIKKQFDQMEQMGNRTARI